MADNRKLKMAALSAATNIIIKNCERSPERCVRNLLELGGKYIDRKQSKEILFELCKTGDKEKLKQTFLSMLNI
ncbi:MAG: hypothetical protein ACI4GV_09810 [Acutalibacteraceae bacterium]